MSALLLIIPIALPCLYLLATGQLLFFYVFPDWLLIGYLYAVLFLICKIFLSALGTLVCLCTAKMRKPIWNYRKNPAFFFWRWYFFRQNAVFRGVALFCQEYFQERSRGSYTVTLHFLVDEDTPGGIYLWSDLCGCSRGWISQDGKWYGVLRFRDDRICRIPKEEPLAESLMELARRRLGTEQRSRQSVEKLPGRKGFTPGRLGFSVCVCMTFLAADLLSLCVGEYLETASVLHKTLF